LDQSRFSLNDREIILLAQWCVAIEEYYSKINNHYAPQEIEWAKDGQTGQLFIVQASPESVHKGQAEKIHSVYNLETDQLPILEGDSIGRKIVTGAVRVINQNKDLKKIKSGDILVTNMTDFGWVSVASKLGGIILAYGSRTSHAAIISREYGIPAIINIGSEIKKLKEGETITLDNSQGERGVVYQGKIPFKTTEHKIKEIPNVEPRVAINISRSEGVFYLSGLPVSGAGLVREEFVIMNDIKIHPRALCLFDQIESSGLKKEIDLLTKGYKDKKEYFVDKLSQSLGLISAAFWPRPVVIRFSDLKSNEYRQLLGGDLFEPEEENPMIGWRGASRYYHPDFRSVFELECRAIKRVREEWGLDNAKVMVPFCRTPEEGQKVLSLMSEFGLRKGSNGLKVYVMAELPSNIILADHFLDVFDGFSIGSNDLTQLILGIDRDNPLLSSIADERHLAVKQAIKEVIEWAHAARKPVSLCGEGPVNFPDLALFLADHHLDSISVAPESVIPMILLLAKNGHTKHYEI
jgi:pyruvate, water dikinase